MAPFFLLKKDFHFVETNFLSLNPCKKILKDEPSTATADI